MTGAEYIAEFLRQRGTKQVFLVTGGACAFIVDAIARNPELKYVCVQHEQAAAMAADALWRSNRTVGVTVVTSGPGATNLITGIACSYFDSIPVLHITGQVNQNEKKNYLGANVRQAGFQETKIVDIVKPITKYSVQVKTGEELKSELTKAYNLAISDRKGPVLIDVPMDVQKAEVGDVIEYAAPVPDAVSGSALQAVSDQLSSFFKNSSRPVVLMGAGVGLANAEKEIESWLAETKIPFVSSWNGLTYINHSLPNYCGQIGVYGNRGANFILQNSDRLLVLGSRLDNRQRSGDIASFAPESKVHVIDVDLEELKKHAQEIRYSVSHLNLKHLPQILNQIKVPTPSSEWNAFTSKMKSRYFGKEVSTSAEKYGTLSPYAFVQKMNGLIEENAIVISDTGAALCWVYQSFYRKNQSFFADCGNSTMGYSLPAAIGASLQNPKKQVIAFTGDGGMQMNIQELQTLRSTGANVKLFILNNFGYGIIKQFQDLYFESRHEATGQGYTQPNFRKVVEAYDLPYVRIESVDQLTPLLLNETGSKVFDVIFHPNTLIEPKLEMGNSIEDQFPYVSDAEYAEGIAFLTKKRKQKI